MKLYRAKEAAAALFAVLSFAVVALYAGSHFAYAVNQANTVISVSFVYMERSAISCGESANIAIGVDSGTSLADSRLVLRNVNDGSTFEAAFEKSASNVVLYSTEDLPVGIYALSAIRLGSGDSVSLPDGVSNQSLVVDSGISLLSDEEGSDPSFSENFVTSEGVAYSNLTDAISGYSERSGNKVFVLDAGHGGWDSGAVANGLLEKQLTLKIAQYCKTELEQYDGVNVVMVRDEDTSLTSNRNTTEELQARCDLARDRNATLYVSFHINAGGGTGAEIWIPRDCAWYSSFNELGDQLGQEILDQLSALGLVKRGTKSDYYDWNGTQLYYPDGSACDSLAVIRHCREYGIPAVLVEHGFIDNAHDASLLSSEDALRQMGAADARAIVKQYGLSKIKKPQPIIEDMDNGSVTLSWEATPGATKYAIALCNDDGSFDTYTYDCTGTSFVIDGLTNGRVYKFLVQAYVNGSWSSFNADDYTKCDLIPWPRAAASPAGDGEALIEWGAVDGAERYAVAEVMPGGSFRNLDLGVSGTSYLASGLANGVEHRFLVQALVGGRWSSFGEGQYCAVTPQGAVRPAPEASAGDGRVSLSWAPVSGAERYAVAWRPAGSQSWTTSTYDCAGTSWEVAGLSNGRAYEFVVQARSWGRWTDFSAADLVVCTTLGTPIMGESKCTLDSLVEAYDRTGHKYPGNVYANKGASDIAAFCQILIEEANAEGVRAEILFAQAMIETGWLQFGGSVKADQCNFGGIGAINASAAGTSFGSVREGLRAQTQHLKAYACEDSLVNACVDPRFSLVKRGIAPCTEDLNGKWAVPGTGYGQNISRIAGTVIK